MLPVPNVGVIPFYDDKVVVIMTHKGKYSFPKGKREPGESDLATALRELAEEAGILADEITLYRDNNGNLITLDEQKTTENENYIIRYFVGEMRTKKTLSTSDPEEIAQIEYSDFPSVLKLPITEVRKEIFKKALEIAKK